MDGCSMFNSCSCSIIDIVMAHDEEHCIVVGC